MRSAWQLFGSGVCLLLLTSSIEAQMYRVYLGNYTRPPEGGIFQATFDADSGKLGEVALAGPAVNPSFLAIHPSQKFLYAVGEIGDFNGEKTGGVSAFSIDHGTGKLTMLNAQSSRGAGPCHVSLDKAGTTALVANYGGGSVASLPINGAGTLEPAASAIQHAGSSIDPRRQAGPHGHSINLDPNNHFAFAADLGLDKIMIYRFDAATHTLTPNDPAFAKVAPGAGPRHFAFHPNGKFAYVINELDNTVTAFAYDAVAGSLREIQAISTLPEGYQGTSYTAEVVVHPSGKFLYGSNRGHDTLAMFQIDEETGQLTSQGTVETGGKTPRNFVVDPTGKWVLVGCQGTNNITVFSVHPQSGLLTSTGQSVNAPSPVCLRFLPIAGK